MNKLIISLGLLFLLAGCATTANYQQSLNRWQGAQAQDLVKAWGNPDSSIRLQSGNTIYMYMRKQLYSRPVTPPMPTFTVTGTPVYNMGFANAYAGTQTLSLYCRTWFEMNNKNVIINTRFEGNNCVAR